MCEEHSFVQKYDKNGKVYYLVDGKRVIPHKTLLLEIFNENKERYLLAKELWRLLQEKIRYYTSMGYYIYPFNIFQLRSWIYYLLSKKIIINYGYGFRLA